MIDDPRLLVQGILDYQDEVGRRTYTESELQQMQVHALKRLADVCEVDTRLQKEDYARTLVDWVSGQSSCVTQIAAGHYHFAAVTDQPSFNLYTWGQNQNGQLGHGDAITRRKPTRVMSMKQGVSHHSRPLIRPLYTLYSRICTYVHPLYTSNTPLNTPT